ncbi:MAG: GNAT family N-acetyltransferase [Anaerolineales bacterium]|nr:GNAT family N-acetyltransferase [Anaerolineales bacterium]
MALISLHDKAKIEAFLRLNVALHLYELGDLDPFFWPLTQWYGWQEAGELKALALLYVAFSPPVLLALAPPEHIPTLRGLVTQLNPLLPRQVYTHLTLGIEDLFHVDFQLESYGIHQKMSLIDPTRLEAFLTPEVVRLTPADHPALATLYSASYPDNAYDPRMLETGQFFGLWYEGKLVSVAGIHVYSPAYRVATIGNVATHPAYRNRGLGQTVIATLTHSLLAKVDDIGLNVKVDNLAAIHTYKKLGFETVAPYHEIMLRAKVYKGI